MIFVLSAHTAGIPGHVLDGLEALRLKQDQGSLPSSVQPLLVDIGANLTNFRYVHISM